jgi:cytochrome c oxidase subunit 4
MSEHITSPKIFYKVAVALMILLVLTAAAAEIDLGPLNIVVALAIASVKALVVILFFMEVKYSNRLLWIFAAAGFVWLAILVTLTLGDVLTRAPQPPV